MSYKQMTGNIISATKVEPNGPFENSVASGVWSLQEQYDYRRGNNWPETGSAAPLGIFMINNGKLDKMNLASAGDSTDFGDPSAFNSFGEAMAVASTTRVVSTRGDSPETDTIEYWAVATGGDGTDFGNLSVVRNAGAGANGATRGLFIGGYGSSSDGDNYINVVDYITIGTTGNTTDFGDLSAIRIRSGGGNSNTRVLSLGGQGGGKNSPAASNIIEYFTITSTGNATDFGDLTIAKGAGGSGHSNRTIAVHGGGVVSGGNTNVIDFVTIASTGNAQDFGDLSVAREGPFAGVASTVSCFFANSGFTTKDVQKITFATTGNSQDFGDIEDLGTTKMGTSNAHGGVAA